MGVLQNLIQTLSLDQTFFYHLILAGGLFFISKKLLFQAYIAEMDERKKRTKGRMRQSEELTLKIEENKKLYEQTAQKIHKQFQEVFDKKKERILKNFNTKALKLKEDQKQQLNQQRALLEQRLKEQNDSLKKELPGLSELLLNKIKS